MLDLIKITERGIWRSVGQRVQVLQPQSVPIAGKSMEVIAHALGGSVYQVRRVHTRHAFVVKTGVLR